MSNKARQIIEIDFWQREMPPLELQQSESSGRRLEFQIYNYGEIFDITGYTAKFQAVRPDGQPYEGPCEIVTPAEGRFDYVVTADAVSVNGQMRGQIVFTNADGTSVRSRVILINVLESLDPDQKIIDTTVFAEARKNLMKAAEIKAEWDAMVEEERAILEGIRDEYANVTETVKTHKAESQAARDAAQAAQGEAEESARLASVSEGNARVSETNAKKSETNAKASETAALGSQTEAKKSETNAKTSETSAAASAKTAGEYKTAAETAKTQAEACQKQACDCAQAAIGARDASLESQKAAKASETAALTSQQEAKTSETNAKTSETNAKASETAAKSSETKAGESERNVETIRDGIVTEEEVRKANETARVKAEASRVEAENARVEAERVRALAEGERATAEAQRASDFAADHERATQDHVRIQEQAERIAQMEAGETLIRIAAIERDKADTTYVDGRIGEILGTPPERLDTIQEIAEAVESGETAISAITTQVADRYTKAEVNDKIKAAQDTLQLDINSRAKRSDVEGALAGKVGTGEFETYKGTVTKALDNKVEKVTGMGLSTHDFTAPYKDKLEAIEAGATKTVINNTLTSTSTTQALSAAQGKALDGKITASKTELNENITNAKSELNGNIQQLRTDLAPVMVPQETAGKPIDAKYMFDYVTAMNAVLETI